MSVASNLLYALLPLCPSSFLVMKLLAIALLLLLTAFSAYAVTEDEIDALEELSIAWDGFKVGGHHWSYNFKNACEPIPWKFLTCSPGPDSHITALYEAQQKSLHLLRVFNGLFLPSL